MSSEKLNGVYYSADVRRMFDEYQTVADAYFKEGAIMRGKLAEISGQIEAVHQRLLDLEERLNDVETQLNLNPSFGIKDL
jgi:predicted nuclease with TOPRIM domain